MVSKTICLSLFSLMLANLEYCSSMAQEQTCLLHTMDEEIWQEHWPGKKHDPQRCSWKQDSSSGRIIINLTFQDEESQQQISSGNLPDQQSDESPIGCRKSPPTRMDRDSRVRRHHHFQCFSGIIFEVQGGRR